MMSHHLLIKVLQDNRLIRISDEIILFEQTLAELAKNPNPDDLPELHLIFHDDCQQPEVMFSLVHFLESFDVEAQIQAFIRVLPSLIEQAPQWTEILYTRIDNDETAQATFKQILRSLDLQEQEKINRLFFSRSF
jgi:hypothetical protein